MTRLSTAAIDHLLFPLPRAAYDALDRALHRVERDHQPGILAGAEAMARLTNAMGTQETFQPSDLGGAPLPRWDIHLVIRHDGSRQVRKARDFVVQPVPHDARPTPRYPGCHLVVTLHGGPVRRGHILPLGYALSALEDITLQPDRYQIYQHRLYPSGNPALAPVMPGNPGAVPWRRYAETGFVYTGLTSRDWATRLREHKQAAAAGSHTLFHRALRGELFAIEATEYEVLRAGLTREEALRLEEIEVEAKSLYPLHRNGLNMIPGGLAGLRFIASFRKDGTPLPDPGRVEEAYVEGLDRIMSDTGGNGPDGSALRRLWAEDLAFRVRAITGRADRLSQLQITFARIWAAAEWSVEKIAEKLQGLGGRGATVEQIKRLLAGRTYRDIPNATPDEKKPSPTAEPEDRPDVRE